MRVAVVTQHLAKSMGYVENMLPRHLARQGAEVHLITMDLSPYFAESEQKALDGPSAEFRAGLVESYDGYTLHVLRHRQVLGYPRAPGLRQLLRDLRPDVVQTIACIGWIPLESAMLQSVAGYKLFTGCHTLRNHFPLARDQRRWSIPHTRNLLTRWIPGRLASVFTEKCFAQATDCAEIAHHYFGVQQEKVEVLSNGVDTDLFHPATTESDHDDRLQLRRSLGFEPDDIVCLYSGKFSEAKDVVLLASTIEHLRSEYGLPFRGLFIGAGVQRAELESFPHSRVLAMMPHADLPRHYRAADIGVWHTNETISALDGAATGLPLVIGDLVTDREFMNGNGVVCKAHDLADLVRALKELASPSVRITLGERGRQKMVSRWSWQARAGHRLQAYSRALSGNSSTYTAALRRE